MTEVRPCYSHIIKMVEKPTHHQFKKIYFSFKQKQKAQRQNRYVDNSIFPIKQLIKFCDSDNIVGIKTIDLVKLIEKQKRKKNFLNN